ncbi:MAG: DUF1566 domain-containing protein [Burkholderiales bacterium]
MNKAPCLINQRACGRVADNPVCPKCGMDERVVYPGQDDREAAQAAALARYEASQEAVEPPPPSEPPKPPTPAEPPPQPLMKPDPESPATPGTEKNGINRLGLVVLVMALLGGGWWWKDQQDQRLRMAQEQAASQALAVEQARSEREAEKKRADEAQAKRMAAEKAQAQMAEKAAEAARQAEAERAAKLAREKQAALVASKAAQPPPAPSLTQPASGPLLHGRYQILAGGSEIKDVQTGLTWACCSVGQRWDGSRCGGEASAFTFDQAQRQSGNGWRVPTARELASLRYCSSGQTDGTRDLRDGGAQVAESCSGQYSHPTIRQDVFTNTPSSWYWSSSPNVGNPSYVWFVNFVNGFVGNYGSVNESYRGNGSHVRMVRTSQ